MSINFIRNKKYINILFYLSLFLLSFLIFFFRFPNAFFYPNFYAEDGRDFTMNIINNGFIGALFTRFNGYYIFGLYVLTYIPIMISKFFSEGFILIPKIMSIVSYGFLAFVCTLPVLLFKDNIKKLSLFFLVLFSSFVPLVGADHAIVGTIGNLKFVFTYVGFLLIMYRINSEHKVTSILLIDFFILVCAYTNPSIYLIFPFIYYKYIKDIVSDKKWLMALRKLFRHNVAFRSALVLGLLSMIQLLIIFHYGLATPENYLNEPYKLSNTLELFIARPYLFSFIYPVYEKFNDYSVVLLFLMFLAVILKYGKRENRIVYAAGIYTIFMATLIFVVTRPGISTYFHGYKLPGGFAQFFYTQNILFYFISFLLLDDVLERFFYKKARRFVYFLILFVLIFSVPSSGSFGSNNFMQQLGSFSENAKTACNSSSNDFLYVKIYPEAFWDMRVPRTLLCNGYVKDYVPSFLSFGLKPFDNNYIQGGINKKTDFYQTFKSPYANLIGLNIYISTFEKKIESPYKFILKDESCNKTIRSVSLDIEKIKDNHYLEIFFKPLNNSQERNYCFTITSKQDIPKTPITLQLSRSENFKDGKLMLNGEERSENIVFGLIYDKVGGFLNAQMQ